jgi:hypothetical protein
VLPGFLSLQKYLYKKKQRNKPKRTAKTLKFRDDKDDVVQSLL